MSTRQTQGIVLCGALMLAATVAGVSTSGANAMPVSDTLSAATELQQCRDRGQSKMLIVAFDGNTDSAGVMMADTIRNEMGRRACGDYFSIAKSDIEYQLTQSGYSTTNALHPTEVKILGSLMSADVIVMGKVVASPGNRQWSVVPTLMSPYNDRITEPLDTATAVRLTLAAREAMANIREVGKMLPHYRECELAEGRKEHAAAVTAAKAALGVYPNSVMARICLASAYQGLQMSPDSILALTSYVLSKNPRDYFGIRFTEMAERSKGNAERANGLLAELLSIDPTNAALQEEIITRYADQAQFGPALQVVAAAKATNPMEPGILTLEATICMATSDFSCAVKAYTTLATVDTSALTIEYFTRLATAHRELDQVREASHAAGRGAAKFPENVNLHNLHAQMLRELKDFEGSIVAARKAVALDPTILDTYLQISAAYVELDRPDSVMSTIRAALPHAKSSADTANLANIAIGQANSTLEAAQADSIKDKSKFQKSLRYAQFVATFLPDDTNVQYTIGVSAFLAFSTYASMLNDATSQSCAPMREARDFLALVRPALEDKGGGRVNAATARQILPTVFEAEPYLNSRVAELCGFVSH